MKKILIIDDSFTARSIIIRTLKSFIDNCEITEAVHGQDALDQIKNWSDISLIILDLIMPVMNGIKFLEIFRKLEGTNHIPIIMITTEGSTVLMEEALSKGANAYIIKPFTNTELQAQIKSYM